MWKQHSHDGRTAYPAQVRTDIVDGEIVGLTAVYDKSSSTTELRAAIDALYGKWQVPLHSSIGVWLWRVEPEQIAIQLADREDGVKQLIFLKFANAKSQLTPSAHIDQEDHGRGCKKIRLEPKT